MARRATGIVFIGTGVYLTLVHVFGILAQALLAPPGHGGAGSEPPGQPRRPAIGPV